MKLLLLFMLLSSSTYAEEITTLQSHEAFLSITPTPISGFVIPQKLEFHTIKAFYRLAIQEYKDANYGTAKELFEATVQRTDAFPKAYFYLGSIYGNIEPFKNSKTAKRYFKQCIAHKKTSKELKQMCYTHLEMFTYPTPEEKEQYLDAVEGLSESIDADYEKEAKRREAATLTMTGLDGKDKVIQVRRVNFKVVGE